MNTLWRSQTHTRTDRFGSKVDTQLQIWSRGHTLNFIPLVHCVLELSRRQLFYVDFYHISRTKNVNFDLKNIKHTFYDTWKEYREPFQNITPFVNL